MQGTLHRDLIQFCYGLNSQFAGDTREAQRGSAPPHPRAPHPRVAGGIQTAVGLSQTCSHTPQARPPRWFSEASGTKAFGLLTRPPRGRNKKQKTKNICSGAFNALQWVWKRIRISVHHAASWHTWFRILYPFALPCGRALNVESLNTRKEGVERKWKPVPLFLHLTVSLILYSILYRYYNNTQSVCEARRDAQLNNSNTNKC